jgi:hypothetical protein
MLEIQRNDNAKLALWITSSMHRTDVQVIRKPFTYHDNTILCHSIAYRSHEAI